MGNKTFFFILGFVLFAPSIYTTRISEELLDNYFGKQLVERFKLIAMAVEEFIGLYSVLSIKGPEVFNAVLKDPKVNEIQTDEMENYLKEFREYNRVAEEVRNNEEKHETFDLFKEFSQIIEKFHHEKLNELSPAALVIHKSLKENGIERVNDAIVIHFKRFLKNFTVEIERYFASLNAKEAEGEKKFKAWFQTMRAEKDTMMQIALFDKI